MSQSPTKSRLQIARLFGIPVRLDPSWFLVLALVTWSLAVGWFPTRAPELSPGAYWAMGLIGALGLFVSILIHEFSHSLVARREGVAIRSVTLFLFGGVAEMDREPPTPGAEARIAIAGPLASLALALLAILLASFLMPTVLQPAGLVVEYLGVINGVLVIFNMVPAFPMDGGRVFRAWLWHRGGDLTQATQRAAQAGGTFGAILIVLGIISALQGDLLGGMWLAFIGVFVRRAAAGSVQQTLIQQTLQGAPVLRFAERRVISVEGAITLRSLVDDYLLQHHYKLFPVQSEGRLVGAITTTEVRQTPKERWDDVTVAERMVPLADLHTVKPDEDTMEALRWMARSNQTRILVVDAEGALQGLLTLKDLLAYIEITMELGSGGSSSQASRP